MEVDISQMIDMIEDHFDVKWNSNKLLTVGGIAGTSLFKYAIQSCMKSTPFDKILVVDGCQDYIGLLRKPVPNYIYYLDLFRSFEIPNLTTLMNPYDRPLIRPIPEYQLVLDESMIVRYDALIVQNAHLIPRELLDAITTNFRGNVLHIVDPNDIYGELYPNIPTLYDALTKQSGLIAFARSMYGIETRSVDRKVRCDFKQVKMNRRGIGKIDDKQYITNSETVLQAIREKQLQTQFRRNQKFLVAHKHVQFMNDQNGVPIVIGPNAMLSIMTASKPLMKLRIHSSTRQVYSSLSYMEGAAGLYVKPANIITLEEAMHHRFTSVVMVLGEEPMTVRQWYSLMKIANIISITKY